MLKNKTWVIAALFVALAMIFGCVEPGLDDGSQPREAVDLVIEGDDIVLEKIGSSAGQEMITIDGTKVTFKGASVTSAGFSYTFPPEAAGYPEVVVYFEVLEIKKGRPGLLIKNSDMSNYAGIANDQDPAYQLNDSDIHFTEKMEFDTDKRPTVAFKGGKIAFQHQAYNNGTEGTSGVVNGDVEYTLEVIKIVFPGLADAKVIFNADGGKAVETIVVQQGKEIGDLPVTTKDGAVFTGWYTTAASKITTEEGDVTRPVGTEVVSDYIVESEKTITLKAGWATASGVTVTKNSLIHAKPAFSGPGGDITLGTDGSAIFAVSDSWSSIVKYVFPAELTTANGAGTVASPYTYKYNVVELTVTTTEDFVIQVQNSSGGNINRYPSGDEVVALKKGVENKFSVALYDSGWGGLAFQNKVNDDGNKAKTGPVTVTLVSAVFTEGTLYKVSFDKSVPMNFTDVATQTIIAGRKATKPNTGNSGWIINTSVNVYDFLGWYLDGKPYDFGAAVTADIDLVSKWTVINQRFVSFNANGGTFTGLDRQAVNVGASNPTAVNITLWPVKTADPAGAGTYVGWFDLSVTPVVRYHDGTDALTTEITKDVTLTAVWAPTEPKVFTTFTANGGYGATATANAGEWTINPSYQRLRLDLGDVYPSYMYSSITIEFTSATPTFRVHTFDASGNNTTGSPYYPDTSTGTVTVNNSGATRYIGFDNSGSAAITLKITKITLNID
jgi:hypothetical protein